MALRLAARRVLGLTAVSAAVVICSTAAPEPGGASITARLEPGRLPSASLIRPGVSAAECRVAPRVSSAGRPRPLLVALGASFTAGVGADRPAQGWAVRLAELIGWRAVTIGVPGAGYTAPGLGRLGPLAREVSRARLPAVHPSLVIVQAGHNDLRIPPEQEAARVARLVRRLRADAPGARLAFVTVFSRPGSAGLVLKRELSTDSAISSAIRKADARAIIIDPLRDHWRFPRDDGGLSLHPDSRGHLVIAERVARALVRAGVVASAAPRPQPAMITCIRLAAGS
jgi:lysophospholipase L1-like esterase